MDARSDSQPPRSPPPSPVRPSRPDRAHKSVAALPPPTPLPATSAQPPPPPPAAQQAAMSFGGGWFNRGRSNSIAMLDDDPNAQFLQTLSQQSNEPLACTPLDNAPPAWASQEDEMPPTPLHPRKRPKVGLESLQDLGRDLDDDRRQSGGSNQGLHDSRLSLSSLASPHPSSRRVASAALATTANFNIFNPAVRASVEIHDVDNTPAPHVSFASSALSASSASSVCLSRYSEEFEEIKLLGAGHGGAVYLCQQKLDGWLYAVKILRTKFNDDSNGTLRREVLKEVFAHAALRDGSHVVRMHSTWFEQHKLYIQLEFCPHGNLRDKRLEIANPGMGAEERERRVVAVLAQVADGLRHIHSKGMAHLDIKPDNVLLATRPNAGAAASPHFPYQCKIGDFGLALPTWLRTDAMKEGDQRYCCSELIENPDEIQSHELPRCDVFALGATVYELGRGEDLAKGGCEYRALRELTEFSDANLPGLGQYSRAFCDLIAAMLHRDPTKRPSAAEILCHPAVVQVLGINKIDHLRNTVIAARQKLEMLRTRNSSMQGRLDVARLSQPSHRGHEGTPASPFPDVLSIREAKVSPESPKSGFRPHHNSAGSEGEGEGEGEEEEDDEMPGLRLFSQGGLSGADSDGELDADVFLRPSRLFDAFKN